MNKYVFIIESLNRDKERNSLEQHKIKLSTRKGYTFSYISTTRILQTDKELIKSCYGVYLCPSWKDDAFSSELVEHAINHNMVFMSKV